MTLRFLNRTFRHPFGHTNQNILFFPIHLILILLFSFWDKTACGWQRNFARISTNEQTSNVEIIRRNEFFHDRWARETWSRNDQPLNFKVTSTAKRTRIVFQVINVLFFTELSFFTKFEEKWNYDHLFVIMIICLSRTRNLCTFGLLRANFLRL